jgi:DNA-binding response OmpR family regulator
MIKILVVEDDLKLNKIVCMHLNNNGYTAKGCLNPQEAYETMYNANYDLIISDIMMPKIDGFEFAETVRGINKNIPILFMTARDDFFSKQKGYQIGIDDYMVKPVDLKELILRIDALLRRAKIINTNKIEIGGFVMDANETSVSVDGNEIPVTVREFNIMYKMLSYPKHTFSRAQLMDEFWGVENDTGLRAVDVYITKLRDKFADCKEFKIVTVHGLGYKVVLT